VVPERFTSRKRVGPAKGERADSTRSSSEDEPNSTRGPYGTLVPQVRHAEENPETDERCGGSARSQYGATQ
jgi:hypothetical protein